MKWSNFKNKVKEDLYYYESEADALDIWDSISAEVDVLNNKKKKKRNFLYLSIFLFGLSSLAYLGLNQGIHIEENVSTIDTKPNKKNIQKKELEIQFKHAKDDANNLTTQTALESGNKIQSNLEKSQPNNSITNQERATLVKNQVSKKTIFTETKLQEKIKFKPLQPEIIDHKLIEIPRNNQNKNSRTFTIKKQKIQGIELNSDGENVPNRKPLLPTKILKLEPLTADLPSKIIAQANKIEVKAKNTFSKISLGINGGFMHSFKQLNAKDPEDLNFMEGRNRSEKTLETLHAKIYVDYALKSNVHVSLGLDYTQINERFQFIEMSEQIETIPGIKYIFTGPGVNPTRLTEEGEVRQTTTVNTDYTLYNQYRLLDIPVLVSYKWNKRKWSYGIQSGVIANLNFNGSGRILESEERSDEIQAQNIFKKSLGISYAFNFIIEHRMNSSLSLVFSPNFRYFPNAFTRDSYNLSQRHQFIGGDIGMKYYFQSN